MPEFTGERVVPGLVDPNLFNEHIARYEFAKQFAVGVRVLDAGCGSGYGSAKLAESAREVLGIDISSEAIDYARQHYPNVRFEQASCTALPGGPFDLITAFEVIEHLEDWPTFLNEASRVLSPTGLFLVSTPNRLYYAESRGEAGANPFHVHEFDYAEFERELASRFPNVTLLTQNHVESILLTPSTPSTPRVHRFSPSNPNTAHFFVAVCSPSPLPEIPPFLYLPTTANLLREREHHIALLQDEVAKKTAWHDQARAELAARNEEYEALLADVRRLNQEIEQRNEWALKTKAESEARAQRIVALQHELARDQAEFARAIAAYETQLADVTRESAARLEWGWETERRLEARIAELTTTLTQTLDALHNTESLLIERTHWAQDLDRQLTALQTLHEALRKQRWTRLGRALHLLEDPR